MSSLSPSVLTRNAPTAETSPTCEVCDRSDGDVEYWPHRAHAHVACAPLHWKKDRADLEAFTARLHRVRYDLTSDDKVKASCSKCDWWMVDWPNGVGDLYRKAQEHVKGERDSS